MQIDQRIISLAKKGLEQELVREQRNRDRLVESKRRLEALEKENDEACVLLGVPHTRTPQRMPR